MEAEEADPDQEEEEVMPASDDKKGTSFLRFGLNLGRRAAITGAAITASPLVIPPLVVGLAFAFPFGIYLAGFVCTDRVMRALLSPPSPPTVSIEQRGEGKEGSEIEIWPPTVMHSHDEVCDRLAERGESENQSMSPDERKTDVKGNEPTAVTAELEIEMWSQTSNLNITREERDYMEEAATGEKHVEEMTAVKSDDCDTKQEAGIKSNFAFSVDGEKDAIQDDRLMEEERPLQFGKGADENGEKEELNEEQVFGGSDFPSIVNDPKQIAEELKPIEVITKVDLKKAEELKQIQGLITDLLVPENHPDTSTCEMTSKESDEQIPPSIVDSRSASFLEMGNETVVEVVKPPYTKGEENPIEAIPKEAEVVEQIQGLAPDFLVAEKYPNISKSSEMTPKESDVEILLSISDSYCASSVDKGNENAAEVVKPPYTEGVEKSIEVIPKVEHEKEEEMDQIRGLATDVPLHLNTSKSSEVTEKEGNEEIPPTETHPNISKSSEVTPKEGAEEIPSTILNSKCASSVDKGNENVVEVVKPLYIEGDEKLAEVILKVGQEKAEEVEQIQGLTTDFPVGKKDPNVSFLQGEMTPKESDVETVPTILNSKCASSLDKGNETAFEVVKPLDMVSEEAAKQTDDNFQGVPLTYIRSTEFPVHQLLSAIPEEGKIDSELPVMSSVQTSWVASNADGGNTKAEEGKTMKGTGSGEMKEANEVKMIGEDGMEPTQNDFLVTTVVSLECESGVEQSTAEKNKNDRGVEVLGFTVAEVKTEEGKMVDEHNRSVVVSNIEEHLITVCHSTVSAAASESMSEKEQSSWSTEYASAVEDQSLDLTDAESGSAATAIEIRGLVHSGDEVFYREDMIWEQIHALRTIVGYKASPSPSLIEELKALYLFTGVEPPPSPEDATDMMEICDKLKFLKSVIGVK